MQYKKYEGNAYNIYTIKTDKFKSCIINVVFKDNFTDKSDKAHLNVLKNMLVKSNKTYSKHRDLVIRREELYNTSFYTCSHRIGQSLELEMGVEFIAPEFIKEENYLKDVIEFNFDMIKNPDVENDEFNLKNFNIVIDNLILGTKRVHESGARYSYKRALQTMDPDALVANYLEEEDYQRITPTSLYEFYKKVINNWLCEIYVIGNLNMDEVVSLIKKNFALKMIKDRELICYVDNKKRKKVKVTKEQDEFIQAHLVIGYNIEKLSEKELITFSVFREILGGGLNSKLYQKLRADNSLCYSLQPIYYKFDRLLLIHVSFDEKNYKKCVKLINESIKEIKDGKVSEDEFTRAIAYIKSSMKASKDNINNILDNYILHNYIDLPLIDECDKLFDSVKIEDVINIANKLTPNFVYLLAKGDNENGKD